MTSVIPIWSVNVIPMLSTPDVCAGGSSGVISEHYLSDRALQIIEVLLIS